MEKEKKKEKNFVVMYHKGSDLLDQFEMNKKRSTGDEVLRKCKFCGNTKFLSTQRNTPITVEIWDDGLSLESRDLGWDLEESFFDYECTNCKKKVEDAQLNDLLDVPESD